MGRKPSTIRLAGVTVRPLGRRGGDGSYRWRAEWYPPGAAGKMRTQALGRCTRDEAVQRAAGLLAQGLPEEQQDVQEVRTIRDLIECWLGYQEQRRDGGQLAPLSLDAYDRHARRLLAVLGPVTLRGYALAMGERYLGDQLEQGYAPSTIRQDLLVLRMAARWGVRVGLLDVELPVPRMSIEGVRAKPIPTPAELQALLEVFDAAAPPHWPSLALLLLWTTGARVSEVGALRRQDFDLDEGTIRLTGRTGRKRGKTGERLVGLHPRVRERLGEIEDYHPERPIWPVVGEHLGKYLQGRLDSAFDEAGVDRFTHHAVRRMVSSQLLAAGVSPQVYEALMGHSFQLALREYAGARPGEVQLAMQQAGLGDVPAGEVRRLDDARRRRVAGARALPPTPTARD